MAKYIDRDNVYIDGTVKIGEDVLIYPNVFIEGNSVIGNGVILLPGCFIKNSKIGDNCKINNSQIIDAVIENNNKIGPFAYIRDNTIIGNNNHIGSFVEIKKSRIGNFNKIPHHSYVGDVTIGNNVNVGAGVIFANYNGKEKYETVVEDNAFIGSNSTIIAPIKISHDSIIAADTTVTRNVPKDALAISRGRQINKENYRTNRN